MSRSPRLVCCDWLCTCQEVGQPKRLLGAGSVAFLCLHGSPKLEDHQGHFMGKGRMRERGLGQLLVFQNTVWPPRCPVTAD
jgi:hypothetical protein